MNDLVTMVEVGPRDGLQMEQQVVPLAFERLEQGQILVAVDRGVVFAQIELRQRCAAGRPDRQRGRGLDRRLVIRNLNHDFVELLWRARHGLPCR